MRDRPSFTALKVARGIVWMEEMPDFAALLPEGVATCARELLAAAGYHKPWHARLFRMGWHRRLVHGAAGFLMPGQLEVLGLRKRLMQDEVLEAIAGGATQVLVVGAGFDTLALRLAPAHPGVTFFEVDHPPTQHAKRAAAAKLGALPANLRFVPADLSKTSLGEALGAEPSWSTGAESVVVAEGVLMYLTEPDVVDFFEAVRSVTGGTARIVFSHVHANARGKAHLGRLPWITRLGLWMMGESMHWAIADLSPFLATHGLRRLPPPERANLTARYLVPMGREVRAGGIERFAVVTFAEPT